MALTPFHRRSFLDPFSLDSPWSPLESVFERPLVRSFATFPSDVEAVAGIKVDWLETPEAHVFKADLPGLNKEELHVRVEDRRTLIISGERWKQETKDDDHWHRAERSFCVFERQFHLPENARVDDIQAKVERGVLTVAVPKVKAGHQKTGRNIGDILTSTFKVLVGGKKKNQHTSDKKGATDNRR